MSKFGNYAVIEYIEVYIAIIITYVPFNLPCVAVVFIDREPVFIRVILMTATTRASFFALSLVLLVSNLNIGTIAVPLTRKLSFATTESDLDVSQRNLKENKNVTSAKNGWKSRMKLDGKHSSTQKRRSARKKSQNKSTDETGIRRKEGQGKRRLTRCSRECRRRAEKCGCKEEGVKRLFKPVFDTWF